jgi:hypothetical protein
MKKVIEFMKEQPYTTAITSALGLTAGFLIGVSIKNLIELQITENNKKSACNDTYDVICVQAHACTGNSVKECDKFVEQSEMCNTNLPDIQIIYRCKEDLRNIECTDDMPVSCLTFME